MFDLRTFALAVTIAGACSIGPAQAQQAPDTGEQPPAEQGMTSDEFLASLSPAHGKIILPGSIAELDLPDSFYYLSPEDAERVLVDAWGNPSGAGTLGMIVPSAYTVLDEGSWAVIVTYEEDGHVDDDDALELDYNELLDQMREQTEEESAYRVENGYEPIKLIGWAAAPRYDADAKKMYWAKEIQFGDTGPNTLNYNVRVLGRKGVLVLNMVATTGELSEIEAATPTVLAMTDFTEGNRYADFNPDVDQVAAYGVGALIAGKLAAKAGLFAKLGVLLIALKKFWIFLVIGAGVLLKQLFFGRKS